MAGTPSTLEAFNQAQKIETPTQVQTNDVVIFKDETAKEYFYGRIRRVLLSEDNSLEEIIVRFGKDGSDEIYLKPDRVRLVNPKSPLDVSITLGQDLKKTARKVPFKQNK